MPSDEFVDYLWDKYKDQHELIVELKNKLFENMQEIYAKDMKIFELECELRMVRRHERS